MQVNTKEIQKLSIADLHAMYINWQNISEKILYTPIAIEVLGYINSELVRRHELIFPGISKDIEQKLYNNG